MMARWPHDGSRTPESERNSADTKTSSDGGRDHDAVFGYCFPPMAMVRVCYWDHGYGAESD
jgi:hypothetical protein